MLFYYIRHGDPIYDPDMLTRLGERQADALAHRIAMHGIDKIFCSTSNRAYQTALPLSELTKKEIVKLDFLNEGHAWQYFTVQKSSGTRGWVFHQPQIRDLMIKDEMLKLGYEWYEHPKFKNLKFKEGVDFFDSNIDEFMLSLGYNHDRENHNYVALRENDERIAVFAHEGVGSIFLSSLLDIPYPIFSAHYSMSHTGMTVISFDNHFDNYGDRVIPHILHFSNDSHIYKEGLPTNYCNGNPT